MMYWHVNSSKGQMKIQQMAFVLVALVLLFALALIFWISLQRSGLESNVETLRESEALELVRKLAGTPEFSWSATDCASCVDLDKLMVLADRTPYEGFWQRINYLEVRRVHPSYNQERCTLSTYPECDSIVLADTGGDTVTQGAFVTLCYYDRAKEDTTCELGKLIAGFATV